MKIFKSKQNDISGELLNKLNMWFFKEQKMLM